MTTARTQTEHDAERAAKTASQVGKKQLYFSMLDSQELKKSGTTSMWGDLEELTKSINNASAIRNGEEVVNLSFTEDPTSAHYVGIYKPKVGLMPDAMLKALSRTDDLVASIIHTRACHVSTFGRELQDRFSTGFRIEPRRGVTEDMSEEEREDLYERIERVSKLLSTCGRTVGYPAERSQSLATFMYLQGRNSVLFGRMATEIVWAKGTDGVDFVHSFRAVDAGTIYQAQPQAGEHGKAVRREALNLLSKYYGERLRKEKVEDETYRWYQVINGVPRQGYESREIVVHNVYPVTDIELGGYPMTPLDTVMAAVMTHINITTHNKLYFQNGRAARGMVIIKSDDNDQDYIDNIRMHFQSTANGVEKSFRIPVFGIGKEDEMTWEPVELQAGRDMEFQYLSDSNARVILSAFQMSPEELPGYQHLARGTNNQSLSESNNEYKLEAARDVGIRPLLAHFQDLLNVSLLPLFDPVVAKFCVLKLYGLDADSPEREATRLGEDQNLHMTYNQILERVEKDPLPKEMGGEFPLNPAFQTVLKSYLTFGQIQEYFFKVDGASKDASKAFYENPSWFQYQQLLMQQQQMQMQQQQAQAQAKAQAQAQQPQGGEGGEQQGGGDDLAATGEEALDALSKGEKALHPQARAILYRHKKLVDDNLAAWKKDSKESLAKIISAAKRAKN